MFTNYTESTAVCGIAYYAADQFPREYHDCCFVGDVVTNRVNLFRITKHGSSPKASLERFLQSADPWFRPVCVTLGPDGALYVADFYNRIIGHYEVPLNHPGRDRERGRIWRIVWKGLDGKAEAKAPRADWTKATTAELVGDLGHSNLTVRMLATHQLVARGKDVVPAVQEAMQAVKKKSDGGGVWRRAHGLWVLERLGALDAGMLTKALTDGAAPVRVHAQRVLAERKELSDRERQAAIAGLTDADADVRRCAAEVLGRHPHADNLRPLLELRHAVPAADTHLLHVVRMALRDQFRPAPGWSALEKINPSDKDLLAVADVALGVPTPESASFLLRMLPKLGGDGLVQSVHHIARYGAAETAGTLLAFARGSRPDDLGHQAALLRALHRGTEERGGKVEGPARSWALELTERLLASANAGHQQAGVELVGAMRLGANAGGVAEIARRKGAPEKVRAAALATLAGLDAARHAALVGAVVADAEAPVTLREEAARTLARSNLPETRAQLVAALATAPARLQNTIALELAASREGVEALLGVVEAGKASARLLQERAVAVKLTALAGSVPGLGDRVAKLTKGLPAAEERLQALMTQRRDGFVKAKTDVALGKMVFTKHCANCHQLGGEGAKVGPQLDGVGNRGLERVLEDVLDPNRNVDQAFRLTTILTKKGKIVEGLVLREEGAVIVLADAQGKEVRVAGDDVEKRSVSQQSPMPANLSDQIPEAEFYHLIAYLLAQRQAPPK
jgi:putative heme-binding domain-containing protein